MELLIKSSKRLPLLLYYYRRCLELSKKHEIFTHVVKILNVEFFFSIHNVVMERVISDVVISPRLFLIYQGRYLILII